MRNTGTRNFGGAVATAGGIVFIGATADEKFRAFDTETGEVLWEFQLPYGGYATPSVYEVGGRQFIVVCAGGGQKVHRTASGDLVYAFALPKK
jgi:quinoprotein glucose dehydrogenase